MPQSIGESLRTRVPDMRFDAKPTLIERNYLFSVGVKLVTQAV